MIKTPYTYNHTRLTRSNTCHQFGLSIFLAFIVPSFAIFDPSYQKPCAYSLDRPLVRITGAGSEGYGSAPTVVGIGFQSSTPGLELQACPQASVENCYARTAGTAFQVAAHESGAGTYGTAWTNCQAWGCGGHGFAFDVDATPHGASFRARHAVANQGTGYALRGTNWRIRDGSAQLNYGWGIEVRGGMSGLVDAVYVEGNARGTDNDFPVEMYVRNHDGGTVVDCYFHGIYPRGSEHDFDRVQRAVNVHDSSTWTVENCTFRRYGDAGTVWFQCADVDVRASSQLVEETNLVSSEGDTRLLSFGEEGTPTG